VCLMIAAFLAFEISINEAPSIQPSVS
jgi:hypothetical protein